MNSAASIMSSAVSRPVPEKPVAQRVTPGWERGNWCSSNCSSATPGAGPRRRRTSERSRPKLNPPACTRVESGQMSAAVLPAACMLTNVSTLIHPRHSRGAVLCPARGHSGRVEPALPACGQLQREGK